MQNDEKLRESKHFLANFHTLVYTKALVKHTGKNMFLDTKT